MISLCVHITYCLWIIYTMKGKRHPHFHTLAFLKCLKNNYTYLFSAALGLRHHTGFALVAVSGAYSPVQRAASHCSGFSCCGAQALGHVDSSCGTQAQLLCGLWDLPGSGIESVSLALAGRFFTTKPPGKPWFTLSRVCMHCLTYTRHFV